MNIFLHASDQRMGVCIHEDEVMFVYFVVTVVAVVVVAACVVSFLYFLIIIFSLLKDEF
jgi:hypothetical protein